MINVKNETSYLKIRLKNAEKTGFEQSNFEQMIMTQLDDDDLKDWYMWRVPSSLYFQEFIKLKKTFEQAY